MIHPVHATELATTRQRELLARAHEYRTAASAGARQLDCSVPAGTAAPACRPDPRPAVAGRIGRRRLHWLRGHRAPHRVR